MLKKRYLAVLLSTVMLFSTVTVASAGPEAVDQKEKQIEENNNKIKELQDRNKEIPEIQNKINGDIDSIQQKISEKSKELDSAEIEINSYEAKISNIKENIGFIEKQINDTQDNIENKQKEIQQKEQEEKEKEEMLGKRLRAMYMSNPADAILQSLLESSSFSDLISRVNNISRMIKMDNGLIDEVKTLKQNLENSKKKLEEDKIALENNKAKVMADKKDLEQAQNELIARKKASEAIVQQLNSMEKDKKNLIVKLDNEKSNNNEKISDLVEFNDNARAEIDNFIKNQINNNNNGGNNNSGVTPPSNSTGFIKPVVGPITSKYGPRIHPITGAKGFHHGVDFGVGYGTPIKAAQSGKVVFAGWNDVYGKMIILDHGNGIQTVYAHSQALYVSTGQTVSQGQAIAEVGTTGMSTGPHLHFEVRINGSTVDPMSYL